MAPIIPMKLGFEPSSLASYIMRYESADSESISDVSDFRDAWDHLKSLQEKTSKSPELIEERLEVALSIKHYMDYLGSVSRQNLAEELELSGKESRQIYQVVSKSIRGDSAYLMKKNPRGRALYHFYRQTSRPINDQVLVELRKIISDKSAPPALKYRVYLHLLYYGVLSDSTMLSLQKIRTIEKKYYTMVRGISSEAHMLADLALASAYAGVKDGIKLRVSTDGRYKEYLKRVVGKLDRVDGVIKNRVVSDVLLIWQLASGGSESFLNSPVNLSAATGTDIYHAYLERYALDRYQQGLKTKRPKEPSAHRALLRPLEITYKKMLFQESVQPYRAQIYRRILDRHKAIYADTGDHSSLEKEIIWQLGVLRKEASLASSLTEHKAFVSRAYKSLVEQEISKAFKKSTQYQKQSTIALVNRYVKATQPSKSEVVRLYASQASIYIKAGQLISGVKMYLRAVNLEEDPSRKLTLMDLAIRYQKKLAGWPRNPPWGARPTTANSAHLRPLVGLYKKKLDIASSAPSPPPQQMWHEISHLGLVNVYLGKELDAANLYAESLMKEKDFTSPAIAPAAFLAMTFYEKRKSWGRLEELGLHLKKHKILPTTAGKTIHLDEKIGLAMAYGGRELLAQKQYSQAVEKLVGVVNVYPQHPLIPNVRFDLAKSYWGNSEYVKGLEELQTIVKSHGGFVKLRQVIDLGIRWSSDLGQESSILYFIYNYTTRYQNRRSFDLRLQAIYLYENKASFRDSYSNIEKIKASSFATPGVKVAMDLKVLELLESGGSASDAGAITHHLIKNSKHPEVLGKAYEMLARKAMDDRNVKKLAVIEKSLMAVSPQSPKTKEVLSSVRLQILRLSQPKFLEAEVQSISLKNPTVYLRSTYELYTKISKKYLEICSLSSTTCVEAMGYHKNLTEKMITHIEDVMINPEYDKKVQDEFLKYKTYVNEALKRSMTSSSERAVSVSRSRGGLPVIVQRMLWLEGKDWNFDPLASGSGSGFISWQMSSL